MLQAPVTIPVIFVHGLLAGLQARGQSVDGYLVQAGIDPTLLEHAGSRVTATQYTSLFLAIIEGLDDETLGLLSRPLKSGALAFVARSALQVPNLESAMRRVTGALNLLQDDMELEVLRDGPLAGIGLRFTERAMQRPFFLDELFLRVLWRLLAWLAGGHLKVSRFDFAFEPPSHVGSYGPVFPAPLQFGQAVSAFWFDATNLERPVLRDELALRQFVASWPADAIVPVRGANVTCTRVREHLQQARPSWPGLTETASALHMATSTLQRRLATEGTSFQALKDELRRDIAIMRLSTSTVPLAALADELGFADSAAFQRAFKEWTGSPPGAYRRGEAH